MAVLEIQNLYVSKLLFLKAAEKATLATFYKLK